MFQFPSLFGPVLDLRGLKQGSDPHRRVDWPPRHSKVIIWVIFGSFWTTLSEKILSFFAISSKIFTFFVKFWTQRGHILTFLSSQSIPKPSRHSKVIIFGLQTSKNGLVFTFLVKFPVKLPLLCCDYWDHGRNNFIYFNIKQYFRFFMLQIHSPMPFGDFNRWK